MSSLNIRKLCTLALGIALFVILSLCLQVPVFENYYLCLGYIAMMVYCYYFGATGGIAVGFIGVILYCLLINGLRGMPGWAIANLVIGLAVGATCKMTVKLRRTWLRWVIIVVSIITSCAIGVLGVKSLVEVLLYAQPAVVRIAKNFPAFVADIIVLIAGLPVCLGVRRGIQKVFPNLKNL